MIKRPLVLWLLMNVVCVVAIFIKGKTGGLVTIGIFSVVVIVLWNLSGKHIIYKGQRLEININTYDKVFFIIGISMMLISGIRSYNLIFNHNHDEDINKTVKIPGIIIDCNKKESSIEYIVDVDGHVVQAYCYAESMDGIHKIGDAVTLYGTKKEYKKSTNLGEFNEYNYYRLVKGYCYKLNVITIKEETDVTDSGKNAFDNMKYKVQNALYELREKLLLQTEKVYMGSDSGLVKAMVLGDKSATDDDLQELYKDSGIIHLLVISGTHISLLSMCVFGLLKRKMRVLLAGAISMGITFGYVLLTGISVSSSRAVIMIFLFLLAKVLIRTYDTKSALGLAGLIIMGINPLSIISSGFTLSFLAIVAIAYPYEYCMKIVAEDRNKRKKLGESFFGKRLGKYVVFYWDSIKKSLILSSVINVITLPVILYCYFKYSVYSMVVNVIVAPFMPYIIVISIFSLLVSFVWLPMGKFLAGSVHYILLFYEKVCEFASKLPFSEIRTGKPHPWQIIVYYLVVILFFVFLKKLVDLVRPVYKKSGVILLYVTTLVFVGCRLLERQETHKDYVQMLDVGQGDAFYLNNSDGLRVLIDGGSTSNMNVGERIIEQYLKAINVWELDYVFISHYDSDHVNGIIQMIEGGEIGIENIVVPYDMTGEEIINTLEKSGTRIHSSKEGMVIDEGTLKMLCLNPSAEVEYKDSNSLSACYYIDNGGTTYLFTGDVCGAGEEVLINNLLRYNIDEVDYLKVAHHGSRYSTVDGFLEVIKPKVALISCGKDNSYGHPHKEVVDKLERKGCKIVITAKDGGYKCE